MTHHAVAAAAAAAAQQSPSAYVAEAHAVASSSHEFFAEIVPAILLVFAVLAVFALFTWVWVTLWTYCLRGCYVPEHWVRFTAYIWGITLVLAGAWFAFSAIGISLTHFFFGIGLFAIAFSAGCSSAISNFAAGFMLQTHNLYASHQRVRLPSLNNVTGRIVSMNLWHVVLEPDSAAAGGGGDAAAFATHALIVPNAVFWDSPVFVEFAPERHPAYPAKPSRSPYTVAQKRAVGAEKRMADGDVDSGGATAQMAGRFYSRSSIVAAAEPSDSQLGDMARQILSNRNVAGIVAAASPAPPSSSSHDLEAGRVLKPGRLLYPE